MVRVSWLCPLTMGHAINVLQLQLCTTFPALNAFQGEPSVTRAELGCRENHFLLRFGHALEDLGLLLEGLGVSLRGCFGVWGFMV